MVVISPYNKVTKIEKVNQYQTRKAIIFWLHFKWWCLCVITKKIIGAIIGGGKYFFREKSNSPRSQSRGKKKGKLILPNIRMKKTTLHL